jgi:hypothetical protein
VTRSLFLFVGREAPGHELEKIIRSSVSVAPSMQPVTVPAPRVAILPIPQAVAFKLPVDQQAAFTRVLVDFIVEAVESPPAGGRAFEMGQAAAGAASGA